MRVTLEDFALMFACVCGGLALTALAVAFAVL